MTDRIHSLTVILEKDFREDDVQTIITAIKAIRGVLKVNKHLSDVSSVMAEERARRELGEKIWQVLYPSSK